jgi:ketosteroid isomerase-like protein
VPPSTSFLPVCGLILTTALVPACGSDLDFSVRDGLQSDAALGAIVRDAQDALNASDANGWVSLFDEYFLFLPAGSTAISNRDSLLVRAEAEMRTRRLEIMILQSDLMSNDDLAVAHNEIRGYSIGIEAHDTLVVDRKELVVYRQTREGWRIARLMTVENEPTTESENGPGR